jgi:hypothetical protein
LWVVAMKFRAFSACAIVLLSASPALPATGNVIFNGSIAATCTLVVNSNGTITASTTLQSLSSHNAGGVAGSVSLVTTGGVVLSVDPVTTVTAPAADVTATTWTPTYLVTGAHSISETGASTNLAAPGASAVSVHLGGVKGGSDRFAAGNYQVTVTVRCE